MVKINNNRVGKKLSRAARNVNLVVTAMRNLGDQNGSTVGKIVEYISEIAEKPASKREILTALRRGVEFGLMDRNHGRYFFPKDEKRQLHQSPADLKQEDESSFTSIEELDRDSRLRSRNRGNGGKREYRGNKSRKSTPRRRRRRTRRSKSRRKSTGRSGSVRTARFARSLKTNDPMSEYYKNPSPKASAVSSIDSMEYWRGEDRQYWN